MLLSPCYFQWDVPSWWSQPALTATEGPGIGQLTCLSLSSPGLLTNQGLPALVRPSSSCLQKLELLGNPTKQLGRFVLVMMYTPLLPQIIPQIS
jgi:hypothetical protein